jgi:hypothetical protein
VTSRITASGGMESNPIYLMDPPLDPAIWSDVFRFSLDMKGS